tara:strand:- start:558 stop:1043 length:486 start_codon:yes stop_codon:yes gene_type:complete
MAQHVICYGQYDNSGTTTYLPLALDSNGEMNISVSGDGMATETTLTDINTGINKVRTTETIYANVEVTSGTESASIATGDSKDRYTQIQLVGDTETAGYKFILEYSTDGSNWFSDGVQSTLYNNGSRYEFSVSRINISVPFLRVKTIVGSPTVKMSYSLSK